MRFLIGTLLIACAWGQDAPPDPKQSGPTSLAIFYTCAPAQRAQLRQAMIQSGLRRFESFREQGILADYRVLFSRYVDNHNWDMLALVNFPNYTKVTEWKKAERGGPGGLSADALALTTAIQTYPLDRLRGNGIATAPPEPVFMVIPYSLSVPAPDYLKYVDAYVTPQFDGWMEDGALAGYDMFLQRYPASRPWDSLILLEYKDDDSLGARERVMAKVRQQLQSNAVWRAASENEQNIRVEREAVIADQLMFRR